MKLTLQCKRFKGNVYNALQWAERQRGLKAKCALGCCIHVGLKDSLNSTSKGATNFMVLRQLRLGPFRGLALSRLSVVVLSLPGQHWDFGMEDKDSMQGLIYLPLKLSKTDDIHSSFYHVPKNIQKLPQIQHLWKIFGEATSWASSLAAEVL